VTTRGIAAMPVNDQGIRLSERYALPPIPLDF
jgi:hypothetical protein